MKLLKKFAILNALYFSIFGMEKMMKLKNDHVQNIVRCSVGVFAVLQKHHRYLICLEEL